MNLEQRLHVTGFEVSSVRNRVRAELHTAGRRSSRRSVD